MFSTSLAPSIVSQMNSASLSADRSGGRAPARRTCFTASSCSSGSATSKTMSSRYPRTMPAPSFAEAGSRAPQRNKVRKDSRCPGRCNWNSDSSLQNADHRVGNALYQNGCADGGLSGEELAVGLRSEHNNAAGFLFIVVGNQPPFGKNQRAKLLIRRPHTHNSAVRRIELADFRHRPPQFRADILDLIALVANEFCVVDVEDESRVRPPVRRSVNWCGLPRR